MVALFAANLTLPLIMHQGFNSQCPQLLEMRAGVIQHIRIVMGDQSQPFEPVWHPPARWPKE